MKSFMLIKRPLAEYEAEATWVGECLITPKVDGHQTSRLVYQLRHGALPSSIFVCHSCDNPHCIRDEHHFTGTAKDNMMDAAQKGRTKCSPSRRAKISAALKGKKKSDEHRVSMTLSRIGKHLSDEHKQKISTRQKGRKKSDLELQHIREAAKRRSTR